MSPINNHSDSEFDRILDQAARQWMCNLDEATGIHPGIDDLVAFQEGELDEGGNATIREHLRDCQDCRNEFEALVRFDEAEPLEDPNEIDSNHAERWAAFEVARENQHPEEVFGLPSPGSSSGPSRSSMWVLAASFLFAVLGLGAFLESQMLTTPHGDRALVVFDLAPDGSSVQRSSDQGLEVRVPEAASVRVPRVNTGDQTPYDRFEIDVLNAEGRPVLSGERTIRDPLGRFSFEMAREAFPNDTYRIHLHGFEGEKRVEIATFTFQLIDAP